MTKEKSAAVAAFMKDLEELESWADDMMEIGKELEQTPHDYMRPFKDEYNKAKQKALETLELLKHKIEERERELAANE